MNTWYFAIIHLINSFLLLLKHSLAFQLFSWDNDGKHEMAEQIRKVNVLMGRFHSLLSD